MNTKHTGDTSCAVILAKLLESGYRVSVTWGDNSPYDLIIDRDKKLHRVQCKTGKLSQGSLYFNLCSVYYDAETGKARRRECKRDEIDLFAVYCPDNEKVYLVPIEEIDSKASCYLRLEPLPPNNRGRKVKWASDYEWKRGS